MKLLGATRDFIILVWKRDVALWWLKNTSVIGMNFAGGLI